MSGTWDHFSLIHLAQSLLTYTPPQKKGNFRKVAFLLGKSVKEYGGEGGKGGTCQLYNKKNIAFHQIDISTCIFQVVYNYLR